MWVRVGNIWPPRADRVGQGEEYDWIQYNYSTDKDIAKISIDLKVEFSNTQEIEFFIQHLYIAKYLVIAGQLAIYSPITELLVTMDLSKNVFIIVVHLYTVPSALAPPPPPPQHPSPAVRDANCVTD